MIKIIECGPFGCHLDKGMVQSMEDIPKGYKVVKIVLEEDAVIYIDPVQDKMDSV
jgi:hypothetical protein